MRLAKKDFLDHAHNNTPLNFFKCLITNWLQSGEVAVQLSDNKNFASLRLCV